MRKLKLLYYGSLSLSEQWGLPEPQTTGALKRVVPNQKAAVSVRGSSPAQLASRRRPAAAADRLSKEASCTHLLATLVQLHTANDSLC